MLPEPAKKGGGVSNSNESQFWVVWCSSGNTPKHGSRQAAQAEARRLAVAHPNDSFYVLKAVSRVTVMHVSEVDLHPPQHCGEPPF